jgi:hypothetical protein
VDPRLLNLDVPEAGLNRPLGKVAIANDLPMSGKILDVSVRLDPVCDLCLDSLG